MAWPSLPDYAAATGGPIWQFLLCRTLAEQMFPFCSKMSRPAFDKQNGGTRGAAVCWLPKYSVGCQDGRVILDGGLRGYCRFRRLGFVLVPLDRLGLAHQCTRKHLVHAGDGN